MATNKVPTLYELQPVDVEWIDASGHGPWITLDEAKEFKPEPVVSRGFFVCVTNEFLTIVEHHGNARGVTLVAQTTAIPMRNLVSISPRREGLRERIVRLRGPR